MLGGSSLLANLKRVLYPSSLGLLGCMGSQHTRTWESSVSRARTPEAGRCNSRGWWWNLPGILCPAFTSVRQTFHPGAPSKFSNRKASPSPCLLFSDSETVIALFPFEPKLSDHNQSDFMGLWLIWALHFH